MIEPIWKLIKDHITGQENVVWREWEDGTQESCLITAEQYLVWIEQGGVPLPADK
jgi:hypothetical protein